MHSKFARVIIDRAIRRELDYAIPESLSARIAIGARVRVPFRDRRAIATVVALPVETKAKGVREIEAVIGEGPTLSEPLLELARWISSYYCCPIEAVMRSLLPQVIRRAEVGWKKQQFVETGSALPSDGMDSLRRRAPRQAELLEELSKANTAVAAAEILRRLSLNVSTLRALQKRGLVKITERAVARDPHAGEQFVPAPELLLNEEQTAALAQIIRAIALPENAKPILLHGVTGSGKTEIYLQAIRETLTRNRTAIMLVPEISLTPQTVERFKSRFAESHDDVAVLHSHLSEGERHDEWHKIHSGRARIVIGARSAVFAPLKNLGLIVVDEEHETSYKQEEAPRYHARDIAVVRARIEKAVVLLGSATPSLESYHNTVTKKYELATLTQRVDNCQMPLIRVIDLRQEQRSERTTILSERLRRAISERIE
jgi:primosomal protein N' (replication factor Y)